MPTGGAATQVLTKTSATDYATAWQTPTVYLTQTVADARYEPLDSAYTKVESDGRYATPTSVTSAMNAHVALADPHPTYLTAAEGNTAYATAAHNHDAAYVDVAGDTVTGLLTLHGAATTTEVLRTKLPADTQPRGLWRADGYIGWGSGSATWDTALLRSGAAALQVIGSISPTTTNTRDLGTTALRWRKLWAVDGEFTNVPTVGGVSLDSRYALASALTDALARITALEGQVADLLSDMAAHTHRAGTWDNLGGTANVP